jgi:hypothetical protein
LYSMFTTNDIRVSKTKKPIFRLTSLTHGGIYMYGGMYLLNLHWKGLCGKIPHCAPFFRIKIGKKPNDYLCHITLAYCKLACHMTF